MRHPGASNRQATLQYRTSPVWSHCGVLRLVKAAPNPPRAALTSADCQGENTKDAVYMDAERRFEELEKETKAMHTESKKYIFLPEIWL